MYNIASVWYSDHPVLLNLIHIKLYVFPAAGKDLHIHQTSGTCGGLADKQAFAMTSVCVCVCELNFMYLIKLIDGGVFMGDFCCCYFEKKNLLVSSLSFHFVNKQA